MSEKESAYDSTYKNMCMMIANCICVINVCILYALGICMHSILDVS